VLGIGLDVEHFRAVANIPDVGTFRAPSTSCRAAWDSGETEFSGSVKSPETLGKGFVGEAFAR
jgi:hypothetical protein